MKKIFTLLLAATMAALGVSAEEVVLSGATISSATEGITTFTGTDITITRPDGKTMVQANQTNLNGVKFSRNVDFTMVIPENQKITHIKFTGRSNSDSDLSYLVKLNGESLSEDNYNTSDYVFASRGTENKIQTGDVTSYEFDIEAKGEMIFRFGTAETIAIITVNLEPDYGEKTVTELSFEESVYTVKIGDSFDAPELVNPYNVAVTYSSSNTAVATVDELTGEVDVVGVGTTKITAEFEGDDEYSPASASYTLNVQDIVTTLTFGAANATSNSGETIYVDPVFTIDGTYNPKGAGTSKTVYGSDMGMKLRANQNGNKIVLSINEGITITSFKAGILVNDGSSSTVLSQVLVDDVVVVDTPVTVPTTAANNSEVQINLEDISATETITLVFDHTDYTGTYKQVFFAGELKYYETPVATAPAVPGVHDGTNDIEENAIYLEGKDVVIYLQHDDPDALLYWNFTAAESNDDEADAAKQSAIQREAAATVEHEGKTYNLHTSDGITLSEAGTLSYFAEKDGVRSDVATISVTGSGTASIAEVAAEAAPAVYYNLQGIRVANPENGVYIRVQGNTVTKVVK